MLVSRLGLTPLKGARHVSRSAIDVAVDGVRGDRVFCLVDPQGPDGRARVLRTVENPQLPALQATWDGTELVLVLPDGSVVSGAPAGTGTELKSDYWGRGTLLAEQGGPFADALSAWLGRPVVLARAGAGDVVYGGPVTVVTTGDLRRLGLGGQDARFRATLTLDTDRPADSLAPGSRLRVGEAVLEVRGAVPRCAVVDLDPEHGGRGGRAARVLAALPVVAGEPAFGLDARVVRPGTIRLGDPAEVG